MVAPRPPRNRGPMKLVKEARKLTAAERREAGLEVGDWWIAQLDCGHRVVRRSYVGQKSHCGFCH